MDAPSENELKAAFAALLLVEKNNAFGIALRMFPADPETGHMGKALHVAHRWPDDPYVKECMTNSIASEDHLPSKDEAILLLWADIKKCNDLEIRVKLLDRYCKMRGFDVKEQAAPTNIVVDNRRVMIVKDHGDDAEWEAKLQKQQTDLTSNAFATRH